MQFRHIDKSINSYHLLQHQTAKVVANKMHFAGNRTLRWSATSCHNEMSTFAVSSKGKIHTGIEHLKPCSDPGIDMNKAPVTAKVQAELLDFFCYLNR